MKTIYKSCVYLVVLLTTTMMWLFGSAFLPDDWAIQFIYTILAMDSTIIIGAVLLDWSVADST